MRNPSEWSTGGQHRRYPPCVGGHPAKPHQAVPLFLSGQPVFGKAAERDRLLAVAAVGGCLE